MSFGFPTDATRSIDINSDLENLMESLFVEEPEVDPAISAMRLALDAIFALWNSPGAPTPGERLEGLALWLHALEALDLWELVAEDRRRVERVIDQMELAVGTFAAVETNR